MLRQNPPFIMHALQDDLAYMTKHLGERLVRETIYLSNHEVLRNFVGEFVSDFRRRVVQLFEQKGGLLTVQHRKALEQADRFAQSIVGDEPTDDGTITMPRQNPPLAEHMETEELSDISALLADRLVRDVVANKDGGALAAFLGDLGVQFRASARKISRTKLNNARAAVLNAADEFAAELERFASTSVVRRRANPPLPEHMAHDDLHEIAQLLAERLVQESPDRALIALIELITSLYDSPAFEKVRASHRDPLAYLVARDPESAYRKEVQYALSHTLNELHKARRAIEYRKQQYQEG